MKTCALLIAATLMSLPTIPASAANLPSHEHFPLFSAAGQQHALCWRAEKGEESVVLCLHGIQTHAGWFGPLGKVLSQGHTTVYALDRRGSGAHAGESDQKDWHGDIDHWENWIADIRIAAKKIGAEHPGKPLYLLGVSWGCKTALGALAEDGKTFKGAIMISPAFATSIDPNFFLRRLQKFAMLRPTSRVDLTKRLTPDLYTENPKTQDEWLRPSDPRILRSVTQRFLAESSAQFAKAKQQLGKITTPLLTVYGTKDKLVDRYKSDQLLRPLREDPPQPFGAAKLTTLLLKGLTHASIVENEDLLASVITDWMAARNGKALPKNEYWLPAYATGFGVSATGRSKAKIKDLHTQAHGLATDVGVTKGEKLTFRWDPAIWWQDEGLDPVQAGGSNQEHWAQKLGRRWLICKKTRDGKPAPYFTVLAHIKKPDGTCVTTVAGFPPDSNQSTVTWTAPASGSLYLSANDSTMLSPWVIFTNNTGTLRLFIER